MSGKGAGQYPMGMGGVPGMGPMGFPANTPGHHNTGRSPKHHHHHEGNHEQLETLHREIQELKGLVREQEVTDMVTKVSDGC